MSLSKWLQHDHGQHNRSHLSPLLQLESQDEDRDDSTTTITSARSASGLRRPQHGAALLLRWRLMILSTHNFQASFAFRCEPPVPSWHAKHSWACPALLVLGLPVSDTCWQ